VLFGSAKSQMIAPDQALPGRDAASYPVPASHAVLKTPLKGPWPDGTQVLYVAMGCFWGAERIFWQTPGVVTTAVGYQGGFTPHPTYDEACSGRTGHTEAVLVAYDPTKVSTETLLRTFWEGHDPTQGFRQGNDRGTQYRSALYWTTDAQRAAVGASRARYQESLRAKGYGDITTDLRPASAVGEFYYAEDYHQQYLYKVPSGYCGIGGTGVSCPMPGTGPTG
jgi:peptide-methionine (S)-S-oxide reductase